MPQVGKKHFSYTPKGKAAAKKYAKKVGTKLQEVGTVTALDIKRKRERKPSDFLSVGKRTTKRAANVGFETPGQRQKASLSVKQSTNTGKLGGGATRKLKYRKMGITAGTKMNWKDKLLEKDTAFKGHDTTFKYSAMKTAQQNLQSTNTGMGSAAKVSTHSPGDKAAYHEKVRQSKQAASVLKSLGGKHRKTKVRSRRHAKQTDIQIAASTEMDWTHKLVEEIVKKSKKEIKAQWVQAGAPRKKGTLPRALKLLRKAGIGRVKESNWIQGAVNPKHKGFCSPMTKATCTPARKALAKRFKKAGRKEKKSGGTGWEGKV